MPQMSPISWLLMFIIFTLSFIMFIILNYYSFMYTPKFPKNNKMKKLPNWKW